MSDNVTYFRNGADALMRQMLSTFGISGLFWIGGIFCFAYIALLVQKYSWEEYEIKVAILSLWYLKAFWSYLLFLLMSNIHLILMTPSG